MVAGVTDAGRDGFDVELGPLFAAGVVLLAVGMLRRKPLVVVAGLGAIWLDQRSELGRSLKARVRDRFLTVQLVDDEPDPAAAEPG